ncbi:hypothetical protein M2271_006110 [Streptomyces sp. LBL]|uniref:hypothetical protein n=1 Tax=Streptomyces sp. LBL TaxID=2940562 RepID=UPI002476D7A0|nr:hypothetical protein [Streptomyces sp. LBL]MDH6628278.1 hypothetical protein [Streptomyces sp. LBL]
MTTDEEVAVAVADEEGRRCLRGGVAVRGAAMERHLPVRTHHGHLHAERANGRRHERFHRHAHAPPA